MTTPTLATLTAIANGLGPVCTTKRHADRAEPAAALLRYPPGSLYERALGPLTWWVCAECLTTTLAFEAKEERPDGPLFEVVTTITPPKETNP